MTFVILGLLALLAVLGLMRLFVDAKPAEVKRAAIWGGGAAGLALVGLMLVTGRGVQALWSMLLFGPALWRLLQGVRTARTFSRRGAASPGGVSDVETGHLAMGLDHDSGRMWGRVKQGRFAGRELSDLDLSALLDLLAELAARDPESLPLLEAWLDRAHPDWRAAEPREPPPAASPGPMTRAEALAILGLSEGASEAEVRAAHRRLMRGAHPDTGGSDWLASRLNAARDTLLR